MSKTDDDRKRYLAAAHAMQSGAAWDLTTNKGIDADSPVGREMKHLRVGVNSAMSDHGALVRLLVAKGIVSEEEYVKAVADAMEGEKAMYEAMAREKTGYDGMSFG